jgi:dGTPase
VKRQVVELKRFLFDNLYRHHKVMDVTNQAADQIRFLFNFYLKHPNEVPQDFRVQDLATPERRIAHYIAGMTDRFAHREYIRTSSN